MNSERTRFCCILALLVLGIIFHHWVAILIGGMGLFVFGVLPMIESKRKQITVRRIYAQPLMPGSPHVAVAQPITGGPRSIVARPIGKV
jgi:hypothetical protein